MSAAQPSPLPLRIKLGYGFGSVAYGIKDNGFAVFLLFYYNQVIGIDASIVGSALVMALFADALFDPIVGHFSDNTKSRIGKRHPWLYGAALPIAIAWLLLWHPPELNGTASFFYILVTAILVRFSLSTYEVPGLAMLPDLTDDYHERTSLMRYRFLFGWGSGLTMMALAFGVFLTPNAQYADGQLNREGYSTFALVGAALMLISILVAALTTHKRVINKYHADERNRQTNHGFGEILQSFGYKPFMWLLLVSFFAFTNQGLIFALTIYLFRHIWELGDTAFLLYSILLFLSVLLAFFTVSPVAKKLGKPRAGSWFIILSVLIGTTPYWLRLAGAFPDNGTDALIPTLFTFAIIGNGLGIAAIILTMSMMADIATMYEHDTGKKSEGLFAAGMFFMQKLVGGVGIFLASGIIAYIGLPEGAETGTVAPSIVTSLNLIYVSLVSVIGLATAWAFQKIPLVIYDSKTDDLPQKSRGDAAQVSQS